MFKKYLSLLLATALTSSLISTTTLAKTTDKDYLAVLNKFNTFKGEKLPSSEDEGKTLSELMKEGKFSDLVTHNAPPKNKMAKFALNEDNLREGNLNNVVVNVRFKGENEFLTTNYGENTVRNTFDSMYNTSDLSLKEYYKEISNEKLNIETDFIGTDSNGTQSVELDHSRNYYRPYTKQNTEGYFEEVFIDKNTGAFFANAYVDPNGEIDIDPSDGIVTEEYMKYNDGVMLLPLPIDRLYREAALVEEASKKANDSGLLNIDKDNNGMVDAITIMVGVTDEQPIANNLMWSELLWPHQTYTLTGLTQEDVEMIKYITNVDVSSLLEAQYEVGDNSIEKYNLYTSDFLLMNGLKVESNEGNVGNVGVVVHELAHTLGLPDFYNYLDQYDAAVGSWDLMAFTGVVPQYTNGYLRKVAGWLNDTEVSTIEKDGEYELTPVASATIGEKTGYIIKLPEYPEQEFFVEYRKAEGKFEGGFATVDWIEGELRAIQPENSGLVVYRIDNSVQYLDGMEDMIMPGNFTGYPYNVYAFRPDASKNIYDETKAAITGVDRTSFGSIDPKEIDNAITFQAGLDENDEPVLENSRVVIDNVSLDEANNKIKFTVDAKDPSIVNAQVIDNKIIVEADEKLSEKSNLQLVKVAKGGVEQEIKATIVEGNIIEISLVNGELNGDYTLNIPSNAIVDVVGKTLVEDFTKDLSKIVNVEKVELNKTTVTLKEGDTETLLATVSPADATNKDLIWTSSDEAVAKVDTNGKISAVAEGTATITAISVDGNKVVTCTITVEKKDVAVNPEQPEDTAKPEDNKDTAKPEDVKKPTNATSPEAGKGLPQTGGTSSLPIALLGGVITGAGAFMLRRKDEKN